MMENNKGCSILPDTLEKYYEDIVKTALAVSIVRTKPPHMGGKVYAQVLKTKLIGNEKHWKSKAQALEEELLAVKEELIQTKLRLPIEDTNVASLPSNEDDENTVDLESMECLTPPSSSDCKSEELSGKNMGNNHAKFLKSIVTLWNAPQSATMLKDTSLRLHLHTTVLQAITVLQDRIHDSCSAETSIPEYCVDSLIGVLDMEIQDSEQTVEKVLCFAGEMISAIMNREICSKNIITEKYSKLIIRLAFHKKITKLILTKLAEQLVTFSNILRATSQEPLLLQGNLNQYNSIHHILWCIENILLKAKKDNSLQIISKSLMATLEDSVLHLSKTFPLFTCYVWRIAGLISAYAIEDQTDLELSSLE